MSVQTFSVESQGNMMVSDNFRVIEFRCKDGSDTVLVDVDFVKNKLQAIRNHFGKQISITSGYRTESYNRKVGGARASYHMKGRAFDIVVKDTPLLEVARYAESIGVLGIIVYPGSGFVHIDSRTGRYFSKDSGKSAVSTFGGTPVQAPSFQAPASGSKFNQHVHDYQWACNQDGVRDDSGKKLVEDGIWGQKCNEAAGNVVLSIRTCGNYQNLTSWVQCRVGADITGRYDNNTEDAVKRYQAAHGLEADGKTGCMTINQIVRDYM